ncbi:MAG: encapsulin-associated ferritin-like protein [Frankia sp.]
MADSSAGLHEPGELLDAGTVDRHRAIVSIMEEFEAVDWYDQRVKASSDAELAEILAHNRDEEKEHAAMTLEWLRRRDPALDRNLRTYLFTSGRIVGLEDEVEHGGGDGSAPPGSAPPATAPLDGSLGIGSLKGTTE